MINLLEDRKRSKQGGGKWRILAMTTTTALWVVYVVGVAGLLGWWIILSQMQMLVSAETRQVTEQVKSRSEAEILVRNLDERGKTVSQFLAKSGVASEAVAIVAGAVDVTVSSWSFDTVTGQKVGVTAKDSVAIEKFIESLKKYYNQVDYTGIVKSADKWTASITLGGKVK